MSTLARSVLASLLSASGAPERRIRKYGVSNSLILMYHRILPRKDTPRWVQAGMVVEPDTLADHIRCLRKYFDIVPLDSLRETQRTAGRARARCVLTFDDGWHDFHVHAYPVLKELSAPATVFLPTDFIGTERWFWTDRFGYILDGLVDSGPEREGAKPGRTGDSIVDEILSMSGGYEGRLERSIALLKPLRLDQIERVLSGLAGAAGVENAPEGRAFINWDEVGEMAASGLISFGSHTEGHPIMTTLAEDEARAELDRSMATLVARNAALRGRVAFCYPNGSYSRRLTELVREAGYTMAVTTEYGWNGPDSDPYALRRIGVHQDMTSTTSLLECRIAGILQPAKPIER